MAKITISLAEYDELRGIKEKFKESIESARETIRKEFVDKIAEMAKEIGRKDEVIKEMKDEKDNLVKTIRDIRNDLCDVKLDKSSIAIKYELMKKRYDDLFNRFLRLLNRSLFARIFRKGESENG